MKYIITENQLHKLNKRNVNRGRFGQLIENMVTEFIGPSKICDIVAISSEIKGDKENSYIVVVMTNEYVRHNLSGEIRNYVKTFLPVDLFVSIDERTCNPHASY